MIQILYCTVNDERSFQYIGADVDFVLAVISEQFDVADQASGSNKRFYPIFNRQDQ